MRRFSLSGIEAVPYMATRRSTFPFERSSTLSLLARMPFSGTGTDATLPYQIDPPHVLSLPPTRENNDPSLYKETVRCYT